MRNLLFFLLITNPFLWAQAQTRGFKTKEQIEAQNKGDQKAISENKISSHISTLKLSIKTNKGNENVSFVEGEKMTLSFNISAPGYLRIVYRLADGTLISLIEDYKVGLKEINKWIQIDEDFICSSPFGYENLIAFASTTPFPELQILKNDDGYDVIQQPINQVLTNTRGMKRQSEKEGLVEAQVLIFTKKI